MEIRKIRNLFTRKICKYNQQLMKQIAIHRCNRGLLAISIPQQNNTLRVGFCNSKFRQGYKVNGILTTSQKNKEYLNVECCFLQMKKIRKKPKYNFFLHYIVQKYQFLNFQLIINIMVCSGTFFLVLPAIWHYRNT